MLRTSLGVVHQQDLLGTTSPYVDQTLKFPMLIGPRVLSHEFGKEPHASLPLRHLSR
jgi:hypothetical protein